MSYFDIEHNSNWILKSRNNDYLVNEHNYKVISIVSAKGGILRDIRNNTAHSSICIYVFHIIPIQATAQATNVN